MGTTRLVFKLIGAMWIAVIVVIGLGGSWLRQHPEMAARFGLAERPHGHASLGDRLGSAMAGHYDDRSGVEQFRDLQRQREMEQRYREARSAGWGHDAAASSAATPMTDVSGDMSDGAESSDY